MPNDYISNRRLTDALIQVGLMPKACTLIDLRIEVDGSLKIRFEKFLTLDELSQISSVLDQVVGDMRKQRGY